MVLTACATTFLPGGGPCRSDGPIVALPPEVPESSGVAPGVLGPDDVPGSSFFWTHNDSGWDPVLFAVSLDGELLGEVRVQGAANVDWEDLAAMDWEGMPAVSWKGMAAVDREDFSAAPCGSQRCLYIADTGDNLERRDDPAIYRIAEPHPNDSVSLPAQRFPLRLPHGPRDIEAMVILPGEELLLITKGRNHPVEVYRSPGPLSDALARTADGAIPLERVQRLTTSPPGLPRMVTGAGVDARGSLVAVRTYETLHFYRLELDSRDGPLLPVSPGTVNLRSLREPQGEAVAFVPADGDGVRRLVLTSEAGPWGSQGQMTTLRCELP